jgi:hypothetical protein
MDTTARIKSDFGGRYIIYFSEIICKKIAVGEQGGYILVNSQVRLYSCVLKDACADEELGIIV